MSEFLRHMTLESHLRSLLYDHDCVIIPEFGGFLTRYRPAHIHALQQTLVPPSKVLTFNRRLISNDGLIAQEIMRREGVSFDQAMAHIQLRVAEMEAALASTQRLVLEGIGTFHTDASGTVQFTPETGQNLLKEAFGLTSLPLDVSNQAPSESEESETGATITPVDRTAKEETPVVVLAQAEPVTPDTEETPEAPRKKRRWMVAAVALPLVAAGVFFMRDTLPFHGQTFGLLNAPSPVVASEFQPRFPEEDITFPAHDQTNCIAAIAESNPGLASIYFDFEVNEMSPGGIRVVLNSEETPASIPEPTAETPPPASVDSALDLYFVVGGAFSEKANADRLVQTLQDKGFDAYVFGQSRGLHLVCYGSYTNQAAARNALSEVKASENPRAWLKRH